MTTLAASCTSIMPRSSPPAMENSTPLAPFMETSSSGELIAARGGLRAVLARATPMPIKAEPAFSMMARTSAKSTLMMPGWVMRSEMPSTPWSRMSSALANAFISEIAASPIAEACHWGLR